MILHILINVNRKQTDFLLLLKKRKFLTLWFFVCCRIFSFFLSLVFCYVLFVGADDDLCFVFFPPLILFLFLCALLVKSSHLMIYHSFQIHYLTYPRINEHQKIFHSLCNVDYRIVSWIVVVEEEDEEEKRERQREREIVRYTFLFLGDLCVSSLFRFFLVCIYNTKENVKT